MWTRCIACALVAASLGGVTGCGSGSNDEAGADEPLTLQLAEQNESGQSGTATFIPLDGNRTRIILELTNPPNVAQPAHVHTGSCDDLGDPLVALMSAENGRSETESAMSLDRLTEGDLVIHAHESDAEYDVSVACAPIEHDGTGVGY